MLTNVEIESMHLIYSIMNSKFIIVSLFNWDGCKLSVRPGCKPIFNWSINIILFLEFIFRMKRVSLLVAQGDVNSALFQLLFMIRLCGHLVMTLNTWVFRTELAQLINETGATNYNWGKLHDDFN